MPNNESDDTKGSNQATSEHAAWLTGGKRVVSPAARRVNALLEHPEKLQALHPVELHRFANGLTLDDLLPLLEVATPEQVRDVVDLRAWQRDRIDRDGLLDWVHAISTLPEKVRSTHVRGLDTELVGFLLRSHMNIYYTDEAPEESEGLFFRTPDGVFVLDLMGETETQAEQIQSILEAMYIDDADAIRSLLVNLMWELPSDLEEWSLRWRNARLEDLGFNDPVEALTVYAYLAPESVKPDQDTADAPLKVDPEPLPYGTELVTALPVDHNSFWNRAIATIEDEAEQHRLSTALVALSNLSLSADRVDPANVEHASVSLVNLRGRLSLGLEHLCHGDISHAAGVLANVALIRISRVGHSLILNRQRRLYPALRAQSFGRKRLKFDLLNAPIRAQLEALMRPRPQLVEADGKTRPFASLSDIETLDRAIAEAELTVLLVPQSARPADIPSGVTLSAIFCTDVLSRKLGGDGPMDRDGAAAAIHWAKRSGSKAEALAIAEEVLEGRLNDTAREPGQQLAARWIDETWNALKRLDAETFDLRFVDVIHLAD